MPPKRNKKQNRRDSRPSPTKTRNPRANGENQTVGNSRQTMDCSNDATTDANRTICSRCKLYLPDEWVVICDDCSRNFHFDCVGFEADTPTLDPWSCPECLGEMLSSTTKQTEHKSSVNEKNETRNSPTRDNTQSVHTLNDVSSNTQLSKSETKTTGQVSKVHSVLSSEVRSVVSESQTAHSKSKTISRNGSTSQARSSASSKASSRSSNQRRRDAELQRAQEEYELQTKIDEDKLALEQKALELKRKREKRLLDQKFRAIMENISSSSGSIAATETGSRNPDGTFVLAKGPTSSQLASDWVREQRKQNYPPVTIQDEDDVDQGLVSTALGVNVSVPVNVRELNHLYQRQVIEDADTFTIGRTTQRPDATTSTIPRYHWNQQTSADGANDGRGSTYVQQQDTGVIRGSSGINNKFVSTPFLNQHYGIGKLKSSADNRVSWNLNHQRTNPQTTQTGNDFKHPARSLSNGNGQDQFTGPQFTRELVNSQFSEPITTGVNGYGSLSNRNTNLRLGEPATNGFNVPPFPDRDPLISNEPSRSTLTANHIAARHSMPKDLPVFYGHPQEWPQFIKRYENTTKLCGFGDTENLERLNKCLQGKAREIVESQLIMPECVQEIIETLREKFGRPELIAKATLSKVRAEPTIKQEKLEALSDYGYKVRNACNVIESMGLHYFLYNPELIQDIVAKLPYQTKIEWARYAEGVQENGQQINLRTVAEWLHKLSRTLHQITSVDLETLERKLDRNPEKKPVNVKPGILNVHDNKMIPSNSQQEHPKCVFCSSQCKSASECSKFKSLNIDEKWKLVMDNGLCRKCLTKHGRKDCGAKNFRACGVFGCELKHNSLLHNEERHAKYRTDKLNAGQQKMSSKSGIGNANNNQPSNSTALTPKPSNTHQVSDESELFRILPINLHNDGKSVQTFAFFDEGSTYTLMERKTADELNVEGVAETICLLWTNGIHRQEETLNVNLQISGIRESDSTYALRSVNVVEELGLSPQSVDLKKIVERFTYLKGLPLPEYQNAVPTILIGMKHIRLTTPLEIVEGRENQPMASRSRLGWSLYGPTDGNRSLNYAHHHKVHKCPCSDRDEDLHRKVKEYFSIENFGVSVSSSNMESKENQKALEMLQQFTVRKGSRFETGLLWKNDAYVLPDSYAMARKRLTCVENKGIEVVNVINEIIEDYLAKGYATKLSPSEAAIKHSRTFYLPIFTVSNPKKPEKIRPVFDAAATIQGVSLNSALLTGPDLISPLVDVLRRFREHRIAVTGDIKEMFHQVLIKESDRHSQRFLWRNGDKGREPDAYQFNVMTFGSTCSPSAAQYVKNKNASEYAAEYPRAAKSIIENHYVDDMLDGAKDVNEAIQLIQDVKFIHSQAGFDIRNFKSNSKDVLSAIGEPSETSKVNFAESNTTVERVLGMFWETMSDCFEFSLRYTKVLPELSRGEVMPTKRQLLSLVMSLYDPLGLISYYVIHAKILLQDVWRSNIGWDEKLPEHLEKKWKRWIELLPSVEELKIPRWYSSKLSFGSNNELHVFVDAGEDAFTAVTYLRIADDEGVDCSLVGSKAKVTPLKYLSMPRKELMAAVLGSRLINSVEKGLSLRIWRRVIWSDSITVLTWLHSEHKRYSQFVAHRIGEILENTNLTEWRWVPTKLNVADEATKWSKKPSFDISDRWFSGPQYLQQAESEWPAQKIIQPNSTPEEMRVSCSHSKVILPSIVDACKFSTWQRLVRAVGNAKRISSRMVAKIKKTPLPSLKLSQADLLESEQRLIRQAQWQGYTDEMVTLTRNQSMDAKNRKSIDKGSPIAGCSPYIDDFGILRVKGRIDSATAVSEDAKRPIILPRDNPVTKLIVQSYHVKFKHHNHETVINELRQRFYIPQIRTVLKGVRWHCKLCALRRCKPKPPLMADLPALRFEAGIRPFSFTGLDYFGPLKVKVGRQSHKRWCVLYTCLTTRGIWLDVVPNYDTESCILSIRDFVNRKGAVQEFFSDNGTYFVGADSELTKEMEKIDVLRLEEEFTSCYTKWRFNPPQSPHMGGMWERLIQAVKKSLYESMITRTPTDQMLKSWLIEAENIVNSRPLTFVPIDSEEEEALTPNHFILGSSNGMKPPGKFDSDGPYLRSQWKEVQRCSDKFWKRFIHEYVPTLIRRTKWFDPVKPLEVGDLVINFDEDAPRNTYKRGRIVEIKVGSKQQVRRAKVQFGNGSTLWRSAHHLGLLDISPTPTVKAGLNRRHDDKNRGENVGATISTVDSKTTQSNGPQSV